MKKEEKIPELIIQIEDKPYSYEDFLDCLANYSALLYKIKKVQQLLKMFNLSSEIKK